MKFSRLYMMSLKCHWTSGLLMSNRGRFFLCVRIFTEDLLGTLGCIVEHIVVAEHLPQFFFKKAHGQYLLLLKGCHRCGLIGTADQ